MREVTAPEEYYDHNGERSVFLAGGISGCPDWQQEFKELMSHTDFVLINPRRKEFDINNKVLEFSQIKWEHNHLIRANTISFWFPKETLCPIVLFELGVWSSKNKKIFIGVDPQYQRRADVEIQMQLSRPLVHINYSLDEMASEIKDYYEEIVS
jgi:hypothetical protein